MQAFLSLCIYFLLFQPREITFLHSEAAGRTQTGHNFSHHRPKVGYTTPPAASLTHSLKNHSPLSGKMEEEGDREEEENILWWKSERASKTFPPDTPMQALSFDPFLARAFARVVAGKNKSGRNFPFCLPASDRILCSQRVTYGGKQDFTIIFHTI